MFEYLFYSKYEFKISKLYVIFQIFLVIKQIIIKYIIFLKIF
jgi:hypothetical protein